MQNPPFIHYFPIKISIYSVFPIFMLLWKLPINWNLHFYVFFQPFVFFPQRVASDPHPPLWRNRSTCSVPPRLETCLCSPPEKKDLRVAQAFKLSPQSHSWEVTRCRHQNTGEQIDYTNTQQKVDPTHKRLCKKHEQTCVCVCSRSVIQPRINRTNRCK